MITRRDVRIKAIQFIYKIEIGNTPTNIQVQLPKLFNLEFEKSNLLLNYILLNLVELCKYATIDAAKKSNKFLPTEDDLSVSQKLVHNSFVQLLESVIFFEQTTSNFSPNAALDFTMLKNLYEKYIQTDFYIGYIKDVENALTDKEIVKKIFYEFLIEDENFLNHLEDLFYSAESDYNWISVAVINFFSNPLKAAKEMKITEDKLKLGIQLIEFYLDKNVYLQGLVDEKLINWKSINIERDDIQIKSERITLLDKIMIKLGIVEMLYFNTIPINVTLNEYIEIAKSYSTEKSGKFINGILDKLYMDFKNANLIQKINFK